PGIGGEMNPYLFDFASLSHASAPDNTDFSPSAFQYPIQSFLYPNPFTHSIVGAKRPQFRFKSEQCSRINAPYMLGTDRWVGMPAPDYFTPPGSKQPFCCVGSDNSLNSSGTDKYPGNYTGDYSGDYNAGTNMMASANYVEYFTNAE